MAGNGAVLVVEDDAHLSQLLQYNLEKAGFLCVTAESGEAALGRLAAARVDLILLDLMLPGMDGLALCRELKRGDRFSRLPIIMLTAKGEEVDRIVGFELGVDDYVVKPFSVRELILRIKAVLKRSRGDGGSGGWLSVGRLTIDAPRRRVAVTGREVSLTHKEFELLLTLTARRGRVQSREKLLEDVWHIAADVTTRTVDTHIRHLRQKLREAGELIETVRGVGYRLREDDPP